MNTGKSSGVKRGEHPHRARRPVMASEARTTMSVARHPRPAEIRDASLEEIARRFVKRFHDTEADWHAFPDAEIEGYKRARHGVIDTGASSKREDPNAIPPGSFTMSVMFVEPGQGNAAHTHETEEVFFVLKGHLTLFLEEETGRQLRLKLDQWDTLACPPGVIHGFQNESHEPVYVQIMLGKARPETMGYSDETLFRQRDQRT